MVVYEAHLSAGRGSLDGGLAARIGFVALRVIWGRPSVRLTGARPFFVCCGPIGCMVGALEPPCLAGEGAPAVDGLSLGKAAMRALR